MSKGFSTMQTNVGNLIQDTSTAMATLIGVWINDAYQDASRRYLWEELIDFDYTITSVADQSEYALESDFEEEIFLANITTAKKLRRYNDVDWWNIRYKAYSAGSIPSGVPSRYIIHTEDSKVYLDPAPVTASETYAFPYKKTVTDLSGTTAPSINNIELFLEAYASSQGFAYKKQFQKSDYYLNKSEFELQKLIDSRKSRTNQMNQIVGPDYNPNIDDNETIGSSNYGL